jgi:NAD(P)-dependent dehydrogenase (short-subunit alcohol dehydrogenase family)
MELQAQVAIVTGAGRGIGRATALELARMGAGRRNVDLRARGPGVLGYRPLIRERAGSAHGRHSPAGLQLALADDVIVSECTPR